MKRACKMFTAKGIIKMSEFHTIPLKINNFNSMKFKWLNASKILVFGGLKNHRTPVRLSSTCGIKNWGLSGYSSVLPRIKFGVTGQEISPQSPTFHTAIRCVSC